MAKYKELVHTLEQEKEIMEILTDLTDEFVESVRVTHPQKYNAFIEKVTKLACKNHFNQETLKEVNNYVLQCYSVEDTTKYAQEEFEIDFNKECFNKYDFNFTINHIYHLFSSIYGKDMNKYTELSLAWLDHYHGKAYKFFVKNYLEE